MAVIQAIFTLSQKFCEHILRAESLGALTVQVRQHLAETRDAFNRYTGEPSIPLRFHGAPRCTTRGNTGQHVAPQ